MIWSGGRERSDIIHKEGHWETRRFRLHSLMRPSTSHTGAMNPQDIARLIEAGLEGATVSVCSDDNTHFEALVVSAEFAGKRPLARHQLVYRTLGKLVGNEIHALSIRALTPDEHAAASAADRS